MAHGQPQLDWQNSERVGDLEQLKKIKAGSGPDLVIQGSSTLYPQLFAHGLIDRLQVLTYPIVLGKGRRLFGDDTRPFAMKLVSSETSPGGVLINNYETNGEVRTGSFTLPKLSAAELARRERWARD